MQVDVPSLNEHLDELTYQVGASHWGWAPLTTPLSIERYETWLADGHHADMEYLETQLLDKKIPQRLGSALQSALVFAFPYKPHPRPLQNQSSLRVAAYAHGADYHYWLKDHLERISNHLKSLFPDGEFLCFTDSRPVLERDLGARAGLGWIGKNTCLIDTNQGSFFLLGEIYTSLRCEITTELVHDFCGTCNRCMEACPTQALVAPRTLDSNKCISYWTIESQKIPPPELREKFNSWFFGCDICQDVCPWNKKALKKKLVVAPTAKDSQIANLQELREFLTLSNKELMRKFSATPLVRSRGFGLKRNALIVIANSKIKELQPEVEALCNHPRLGELAQWCLSQIKM